MDIFGFSIPLWFILLVVVGIILYRRVTADHGIFKEQGIPGPTPLPLLGTVWHLMMHKGSFLDYDFKTWNKYGKPRYMGSFFGGRPRLMIFDKDLIQRVMVKDFNSFTNRANIEMGYPLDKMVSVLVDDEWRRVRHQMSPAFSGSKMRRMVHHITRCGHNMVEAIEVSAKSGDQFDIVPYSQAFTMDSIASVAFGLEVNCQGNKDNPFLKHGRKFSVDNFSFKNPATWALFLKPSLLPYLAKLGFPVFDKKAVDFFLDIVERAIKDREQNPENLPTDFLQMLIAGESEETEKDTVSQDDTQTTQKGFTKDEILAQTLIFFLAGLNNVSAMLANTVYYLIVNQDVQEKAYQEVQQVIGDRVPDYDDVKKLKYIEMCLEETNRILPLAGRVDRVPKEEMVLDGIKITSNMGIDIPVAVLHHDPDAWPEPDKFDPERFTPEAKAERHPFQYIPFGAGPRVCIATRLAMMEAILAVALLLQKYKLLPSEKTEIPLQLKKLAQEAKNGIWLKVEERH